MLGGISIVSIPKGPKIRLVFFFTDQIFQVVAFYVTGSTDISEVLLMIGISF